MQEVPHPSVAQHNTVKQFDCCGRGNSEYKYIFFGSNFDANAQAHSSAGDKIG